MPASYSQVVEPGGKEKQKIVAVDGYSRRVEKDGDVWYYRKQLLKLALDSADTVKEQG